MKQIYNNGNAISGFNYGSYDKLKGIDEWSNQFMKV
jgi:hypothetical protein